MKSPVANPERCRGGGEDSKITRERGDGLRLRYLTSKKKVI